jgi:hypothetical protein
MIYMEGAAFVATFLEPFSSFFPVDLDTTSSRLTLRKELIRVVGESFRARRPRVFKRVAILRPEFRA